MVLRHQPRAPEPPRGAALDPAIFAADDPRAIADALKRSAEANPATRVSPLRSAMAMLTFHINRAGTDLPPSRREVLEAAKAELRRAFGRGDQTDG
ncbi:DUF3175 domain-containing protein [Sphingomonas jatrophae]|uniref:DUF3175 domain-containing protein n=1 Tax=Sphingomonas jatrophae TaxID=1166337 RepID=A0A1I6K4V9_9SPHN|nr:DUF3175 domain-containing protein [Sphingomonas jatrophae]SFR86216.1 Protein of unknown function [Sphingomonas jatrophae]